MKTEEFQTLRELKNKYPSGIFICPNCAHPSLNPHYCIYCHCQSNNFVYTDSTYKYTVIDTAKTDQIFKPAELGKG